MSRRIRPLAAPISKKKRAGERRARTDLQERPELGPEAVDGSTLNVPLFRSEWGHCREVSTLHS